MVKDRTLAAIQRDHMIPKGGRVLVAVSGGLDSMVLLHVLRALSTSLGFSVVAGHVDHGLRGEASRLDAAFVEDAARQLGVAFRIRTLAASDIDQYRVLGREGAARAARRQALSSIAEEMNADRIALAHRLEDRAETLLFNFARGAGGRGFTAMPAVCPPFIRPLLEIDRAAVLAYARAHGIVWREDASNTDVAFSRNRIRHHVLPELRRINPQADVAVCRSAGILGELSDAADALALDWVDARLETTDQGISVLNMRGSADLQPSALKLVLRAAILRSRGSLVGITAAHVKALLGLVLAEHAHASYSLPNLTVRREGDTLQFSRDFPEALEFQPVEVALGTSTIEPLGIRLHLEMISSEELSALQVSSDEATTEWIDADAVSLPLHLRTRKPGDRFTPLGLDESVRLKHFLINEHVSYFDRDCLPLLCDRDRIVWVVGIRISDTVKISPSTQRVLRMRVEETPC